MCDHLENEFQCARSRSIERKVTDYPICCEQRDNRTESCTHAYTSACA